MNSRFEVKDTMYKGYLIRRMHSYSEGGLIYTVRFNGERLNEGFLYKMQDAKDYVNDCIKNGNPVKSVVTIGNGE